MINLNLMNMLEVIGFEKPLEIPDYITPVAQTIITTNSGNLSGLIMNIFIGVLLFIFVFTLNAELKDNKKEICPRCNDKTKLLKCSDKKCKIKLCSSCNVQDDFILDSCMICNKNICKEHLTNHTHKMLWNLFKSHKPEQLDIVKLEEPEEVLSMYPVEYYGYYEGDKEFAVVITPDTGPTDRKILFNTILRIKSEGFEYKACESYFHIMQKKEPSLIEVPTRLETYDFVESEELEEPITTKVGSE